MSTHSTLKGLGIPSCTSCYMSTNGVRNYHPYAACLMFKGCRNGNTVESNLRAVVEYGMKAQAAGISLDEAMTDIAWQSRKTEENKSKEHGTPDIH